MERWRWLPRDLGDTYVMVNIPDYTLKVVHDHQVVWRTKIVAGKPQTPTPLLSASMDNVIVNPSWYVPQSIIQNELLPLYAERPEHFRPHGPGGEEAAPTATSTWCSRPAPPTRSAASSSTSPTSSRSTCTTRRRSGCSPYDKRAFSHGCMRVQDPTKFGEIMLHLAMNGPTPNARQLYAMFGQDERDLQAATSGRWCT